MAKLDDFIREQFDREDPSERFPYREEHWAQALPLIEAAEQKRKRRGLLWWLAGLLLLCGGWWGWHIAHVSSAAARPPVDPRQETSVGSNIPTAPLAHEVSNYSPGDLGPIGERELLAPGADRASRQAADAIENEKNESIEPVVANTSVKPARFRKRGTPAERSGLTPDNQGFKKNKKRRNGPANLGQSKVSIAETKSTDLASTDATIATAYPGQAPPRVVQPASATMPDVLSSTAGQVRTADDLTATALQAGAIDSISISPATWRSIPTLPITFRLLSNEVGGMGVAQVPYNFPLIEPVREPRFAFGLQVAASAYRSDSTSRQGGGTAGFYAAYWLRPAWSLSTGIGWRGQPTGDRPTDALTTTYRLRYRFGYEEETFKQINHRLDFVELPLSVRWQHCAWQLEAGAMYGQLLGTRATLIHSSRSSLGPVPETTERSVRGEKGNYNQRYVAPFAGLGWQPLRFLHLEVRASYRTNPLLHTTVEQTGRSGTWRLDAGLRWQLFSKERIRVKQ